MRGPGHRSALAIQNTAATREVPRKNVAVGNGVALNDHIVSRGLQKNFAQDGHRIAVLDCRTGAVLDEGRSITSNFAEPDFLTYYDVDGNPVRDVDDAFTRIERKVLNLVREVTPASYEPTRHHESIVQLMSIHLVRSRALRASKVRLFQSSWKEMGRALSEDPDVRSRFMRVLGRPPYPGEIEESARRWTDQGIETGAHLIENLPDLQQRIARLLGRYRLQIVQSPPELPGFVLGDVPAVHASLQDQRYGFQDGLAVGDADWASIALSRRTVAVFSADGRYSRTVRTAKLIHSLNLIAIRTCEQEVACHPDDVIRVQRLIRRPEPFVTVGQLVGR